jgi:hypothetical protein
MASELGISQYSDYIRGEMRNEIISQFTSKMSETAISVRKLQEMGFKGKKLENYMEKSPVRIR